MKAKSLQSTWLSPKITIQDSSVGGKGMFANNDIGKGESLVIWGGYTNRNEAEKAKEEGKLVMQWDDDLFSVEERGDDEGYFINHSCEPNIWMQDAFTLTSKRYIHEGEELTADYAMWEADENYVSKWECKCDSENCRKRITGKDWRLPELQERYKRHFSPLINKRIKKDK